MTFFALFPIQQAVRGRFDQKIIVGSIETIGLLLVLVLALLVSSRLIDRRPVTEYGLSFDRGWMQSFAIGGLIATVVNAGTFLTLVGAGWASVVDTTAGAGPLPFPLAFVLVFAYVAVAAAWEEFIFRGAMLQNIAEGVDGYVPQWAAGGIAILFSSIVFTFMHGGKVDHYSLYGYYLVAGVIFGVVYVLSGDLALPIGFHLFYNFTMTAVYGIGGSQQSPELLVLDIAGPAFWVGEEGFLRVIFAVVGGALLLTYIRWRDGELDIDARVMQWSPIIDQGS